MLEARNLEIEVDSTKVAEANQKIVLEIEEMTRMSMQIELENEEIQR
jgi:hypothetical protein